MKTDLQKKLEAFAPISLTEMNAEASFLDRVDTKYIMSEEDFEKIVGDLEDRFYLLHINGKSIFEYSSIYMDTKEYDFYFQHQNKINPRLKVRTRLYVESNIAFFEFKQKENKITRKFRFQFSPEEHGKMGEEANKFFSETYKSLYQLPSPEIFPSLETKYNRLTFCSKKNDERVTVDFGVSAINLRDEKKASKQFNNLVILESKSSGQNCTSYKIMEKHSIIVSNSCSKYSLGVAYLNKNKDSSRFTKTMTHINKIAEK